MRALLLVCGVVTVIGAAWSDRLSDISDGAFIDGRALYDLLGGGPRYSDGLSPLVLQWMDHDTSAYEDRPRRPGPMRLWVVRGAWRSSDGRVCLRARCRGGGASAALTGEASAARKAG